MPTAPHYDDEMIAIYRRYTRLHHDLIPYTMPYAELAARTGMPIARPLVFAYPDDPAVRDRWDEYLYGDDLLVAPLWRDGERMRDVYLPAGSWEDFWDSSRTFDGPATVTVDAPLDRIPVFVPPGVDVPRRPRKVRRCMRTHPCLPLAAFAVLLAACATHDEETPAKAPPTRLLIHATQSVNNGDVTTLSGTVENPFDETVHGVRYVVTIFRH